MAFNLRSSQWCTLIRLKKGSQPSDTGTIRISKGVSRTGAQGYRAVFSYTDHADHRKFGAVRPTAYEATLQLLTRFEKLWAPEEQERIAKAVKVEQMGPQKEVASEPKMKPGSKPNLKRDGATLAPAPCEGFEDNVAFVHQIFGVFKDGKPKPDVFKESIKRWKQVAVNMGAGYHEWTPDEVETLIRTHYSDYWDIYVNCRYPVMRVDIARILILHFYGGIYSDMDVWPNRCEYERQQFAVCAVPAGLTAKQNAYFDMEVLSSNPKNPILLKWMDYIREQIRMKNYKAPGSVWKVRRARYVYYTTGPYGLNRFLNLPENKDVLENTGRISCNRFEDYEELTSQQKQVFDVLTRRSNSYFTKEFEIKVQVSTEDVPLPFPATHITRISQKSWIRATVGSGARSQARVDTAERHPDQPEEPRAEPPSAAPTAIEETDEETAINKNLLENIIGYFCQYQRSANKKHLQHLLLVTFKMCPELVEQIDKRIAYLYLHPPGHVFGPVFWSRLAIASNETETRSSENLNKRVRLEDLGALADATPRAKKSRAASSTGGP